MDSFDKPCSCSPSWGACLAALSKVRRDSAHSFKSPPRHLDPGRRWPTALQSRPPDDGANAPTANSHAPRLQPAMSSPPLRIGGLPFWATACTTRFCQSQSCGEERNRGRPRPRQKPRLTSPTAFQQNIGTRKMTQGRDISSTQPSRQPKHRCSNRRTNTHAARGL